MEFFRELINGRSLGVWKRKSDRGFLTKRLPKKNFQTPSSKISGGGGAIWVEIFCRKFFLDVIFFLIFQYPFESLVVIVL